MSAAGRPNDRGRTASAVLVAVVFAGVVAVGVALMLLFAGCTTDQCIGRGVATTYRGAAVFGAPADGAVARVEGTSLVIDDFSPGCSYDAMRFTVRIEGCLAEAYVTHVETTRATRTRGPQLIFADLALAPHQACTLALGGRNLVAIVESGTLRVEASGSLVARLALTTDATDGGPNAPRAVLDYQFTGAPE